MGWLLILAVFVAILSGQTGFRRARRPARDPARPLLGVELIEVGVRLRPGLPLESYSFESPLLGVSKSKVGYEEWYAPAAAGEWTVHVTLPESGAGHRMCVEINGKRSRVVVQAGGVIRLRRFSGPEKPLRWSLRR